MNITHTAGNYTLYKEKTAIGTATLQAGRLWVEIDPGWRRRGYGSYLVKEILQQNEQAGDTNLLKIALLCSLSLYLDFINLFIYLLRIFGDRK